MRCPESNNSFNTCLSTMSGLYPCFVCGTNASTSVWPLSRKYLMQICIPRQENFLFLPCLKYTRTWMYQKKNKYERHSTQVKITRVTHAWYFTISSKHSISMFKSNACRRYKWYSLLICLNDLLNKLLLHWFFHISDGTLNKGLNFECANNKIIQKLTILDSAHNRW